MSMQTLTHAQIEASAGNPRKNFDDVAIAALAQSIKTDGLLQNLVVAKPKGRKKKHQIIAGERRFRALQLLIEQGDLPEDFGIAVEIKEGLSAEETLRMATMENMQREDLSPLEEAEAIKTLVQDGEKLDDIVAKTGLTVSTIRRRLVLTDLSENVKAALADGEITLSQAEAFSVGSHDEQDGLLDDVKRGWYDSAEDIKDRLVGELPALSMAIFDKEQYTGDYTQDLLAEEDATYFNDIEQFFDLQKAAAERLASEHGKTAEWAELLEGYFHSWEYGEAGEGEKGGVIVVLEPSGKVEVHEGLTKTKADRSTTAALKRPKATYAKPLVRYMAMHKSIAVQAALLENPRKAKELAVANKLYRFSRHDSLGYFEQDEPESNPPALHKINAKAKELYALFDTVQEDTDWRDLGYRFSSPESAYDYVQGLSDADLEGILVTLEALQFGQGNCDRLDTYENTIFNRIAADLRVDMRDYWRPDGSFLKRRNKTQLQQIITDAGCSSLFGSVAGWKKKELVSKLAAHFQKVLTLEAPSEDELKATFWIPEAMQFPAIDPDAKQDEPEEDFEQDEEELAEAA